MEPILAGFQKALFHFVTKCFFVLAVNPAIQWESCQKGNRQRCIRITKCVLVSRAVSRPEMIFLIAGTLAGNGGRPLQTLQEICRASEVMEATGPAPGFWRRFARRFRRHSNDDWLIIFIRHQHGRKFRRLSSMIAQSYTGPIRVKPLRNGVFVVIHPYPEKNDCDDALDLEMPDGDERIQTRQAGLIDSSPKISPAAGSTSPPPRRRPAQARPDNNVFAREFRMGGNPFLPCFD